MRLFQGSHERRPAALEFFKYLGPGLLVTVGFIDPGNWASNIAASAQYGYALLWIVTLATVMLILLQHNAAHLGIATGLCLSEAVAANMRPGMRNFVLGSAMLACVSTALAELLGAAIALNMLFRLPLLLGVLLSLLFALAMLLTNSYRRIEKWIIGFVSVIGFAFLYELTLVKVGWPQAAAGWFTPAFPKGAMPLIMSVLGAVVMPHNLFLHSEVIQSRQWNLQDEAVIKKQLKFEFGDTLFSMGIGWAINSAMMLVAAATFFNRGVAVTELGQAQEMLKPLLGPAAAVVFALALLFSGLSSCVTAGMAGGSIFAGVYSEHYDIKDSHSRMGVLITLIAAALAVVFISNPLNGLVYSQMLLSVQLPITIFAQIRLTSSKAVMGAYANTRGNKALLWATGVIVTGLNAALFVSFFT